MSEQGKYRIDLVHLQGFFSLFQIAHKPQPYSSFEGEVLLSESEDFSSLFDKST